MLMNLNKQFYCSWYPYGHYPYCPTFLVSRSLFWLLHLLDMLSIVCDRFLTLVPGSRFTFSTPGLESAISSRSHASFYWPMVLDTKIQCKINQTFSISSIIIAYIKILYIITINYLLQYQARVILTNSF